MALMTRRWYWRSRLRALLLLGGKCVRCGIDDPRVLNINHLHGGGSRELRGRYSSRKGGGLALDLVKGRRTTDGLEVRCSNCNILYEYETKSRSIPEGIIDEAWRPSASPTSKPARVVA